MSERKNLSEPDVALVQLCERYGAGRRGPERRALMAKIINLSVQRALSLMSQGKPQLADELGDAFTQIFGMQPQEGLEEDVLVVELNRLIDESMITGLDKFDLIPQTVTEFYKKTQNDGFRGLVS